MKGRSALPRMAFIVGLLAVAGGISVSAWAPSLLSRIAFFDVRRVEVVGANWLAPDYVLRLAGIGNDRSTWDDYTDVEARLLKHALIEEAQVRRSGLHGLRIVVREVEPLALVGVPGLRAVRGDGTLLPIEPAGTSLDLPLLTESAEVAADSARLKEGPARRALEAFARVHQFDPGLATLVSDFRLLEEDGLAVNLVMSQPVRRIALPERVDEALLRRLRAALADLRQRGIAASLVEARYADQIVVRR